MDSKDAYSGRGGGLWVEEVMVVAPTVMADPSITEVRGLKVFSVGEVGGGWDDTG